MPSYGLLTNPSNEIISEINKIYELNFDYTEIGIEGPEGNPDIINKKGKIVKLLEIQAKAYWSYSLLDGFRFR
jgi:hypothetical protein